MKIATWNVNSINARLEHVLSWFRDTAPDVVALQEIKCVDEKFPTEAFESLGYNVAVHGQKTYNGVALLSKYPLEDIQRGLPGDDTDEQARYIEALVAAPRPIRVGGIYLPNGNPVDTDKFRYKLAWFERLTDRARAWLAIEEPLALIGDYNVIPQPADCHDPAAWAGDALFRPESRQALQALTHLGFSNAVEARGSDPHAYTFWDYQAGAWQRNNGIRIDHILLSPQAADRLVGCEVDRDVRGREKPSDHVPVIAELAD
jgi:exodeoxyribonuclease III